MFGNTNIFFEFGCCLEKKPIFSVDGKGFICDNNGGRGTLFIYVVIEGVNWIDNNELDLAYAETTKDTIKLMFPPLVG